MVVIEEDGEVFDNDGEEEWNEREGSWNQIQTECLYTFVYKIQFVKSLYFIREIYTDTYSTAIYTPIIIVVLKQYAESRRKKSNVELIQKKVRSHK